MDFRLQQTDQPLFSRYDHTCLIWGERSFRKPFFILSDGVTSEEVEDSLWQETSTVFDCLGKIWPKLLASIPEVIIVGTGEHLRFPSLKERTEWGKQGLASLSTMPVEWMDTPAACRTYNILVGERRKVAGLFWIDQKRKV